jgi:YggT family protein
MSNHTIDLIQTWLRAFVDVYTLLIIAWILASWVRLPYSVWIGRIRTFLDDTVSPFVALFRRVLPRFGPLDLSPMVAIIALQVAERILQSVLDGLRPGG